MHRLLVMLFVLGCVEPSGGQVADGVGDPTCTDDTANGDESDVDCGGSCEPCEVAKRCNRAADCESLSCDTECIAATCSDGILNGSETSIDCGGPACASCTVDGGEPTSRDMGAEVGPDADAGFADAGTDMRVPVCGDGIVDQNEECDDANLIDTDDCIECQAARCGDGYVQGGVEDCDDQNDDDDDACIACRAAACGDGFVQAGVETCDDANDIETDACIDCAAAFCGDGYVHVGTESCDTAGQSAACDADCTLPVCGDGVVNTAAGEDCEGVSGCGAACRWMPLTYVVTDKSGLVGLASDCSTSDTFPHTCSLGQQYGFMWTDATPYQPGSVRVEFSTGNYCSTSRLKDTLLNGAGSGQFVLADMPCACESPNPQLNVWDLFNVQGYGQGGANTFTMTTQNGCEGLAWTTTAQFYARITVAP